MVRVSLFTVLSGLIYRSAKPPVSEVCRWILPPIAWFGKDCRGRVKGLLYSEMIKTINTSS